MSDDLVTTVIPTYNYGRFVTEAVESALAQTYRRQEILVVDDGSTDDTRERLRPYQGRIRYLYQRNQGLSAARNTGIRAARGEFIALLDSDDIWHPQKLELQMQYVVRHPEVGLLATDCLWDLDEGWPPLDGASFLMAHPVALEELVVRTPFGPSGVLVRKECFQMAGGFDTELRSVEDRDMWIRIARHFPVAQLRVPLWWLRVHGGSMSTVAARMEENELKVLRKAFSSGPLRRRLLLRQKAFSYAAFSSAFMHDAAGMRVRALAKLLRSLLLWPIPYRRREVEMDLVRPKMLIMILWRLLQGARMVRRPLRTSNAGHDRRGLAASSPGPAS
ncbi:MAG: glycosyltransferase family 2 protein [Isosphaeraceae bacterium]|nr:glycosyltransferase family 2 protein [Isosphaeraceae bacterium]